MINLVKTIVDIQTLDNAIFNATKDGHRITYIIMNSRTLKTIDRAKDDAMSYQEIRDYSNMIDYIGIIYRGYNVALCENLKYGEVDIIYE